MCFLWQNTPLFMNSRKYKYNFISMVKMSKQFCLTFVEILPKFSTNQTSGDALVSPVSPAPTTAILPFNALPHCSGLVKLWLLIPRRTSSETTIEPPLCVVVKSLALNHHALVQLPVKGGCHTLRMPLSLRFMGKPVVEGICRLLLRPVLDPGQYVVSKIVHSTN